MTTTNHPQIDLLNETILTSEQLYRLELAAYPDVRDLSSVEKEAIVTRAREGDMQARDTLIGSLLHLVATMARISYTTHRWAYPHISYLDLVGAANLALVEKVDYALQSRNNPYAYLTVIARGAIRNFAKRYGGSLIATPSTSGVYEISTASLDIPLCDGDDETVGDSIVDNTSTPGESKQIDYAPLHAALATLGEARRTVLIHHYGLFGHAPIGLCEIDRTFFKGKRASSERTGTLDLLRMRLAPAYPQLSGSIMRPSPSKASSGPKKPPTPVQESRLDQALTTLLERGEKVTRGRLSTEACVSYKVASSYLNARAKEHPEETREQRMERVFQSLQSQSEETSGQRFTIEQFAKQAHVSYELASAYVHSRRSNQYDPDTRLDQALTTLLERGEKVTVRALQKAAHVGHTKVRAFLSQSRLPTNRDVL